MSRESLWIVYQLSFVTKAEQKWDWLPSLKVSANPVEREWEKRDFRNLALALASGVRTARRTAVLACHYMQSDKGQNASRHQSRQSDQCCRRVLAQNARKLSR